MWRRWHGHPTEKKSSPQRQCHLSNFFPVYRPWQQPWIHRSLQAAAERHGEQHTQRRAGVLWKPIEVAGGNAESRANCKACLSACERRCGAFFLRTFHIPKFRKAAHSAKRICWCGTSSRSGEASPWRFGAAAHQEDGGAWISAVGGLPAQSGAQHLWLLHA